MTRVVLVEYCAIDGEEMRADPEYATGRDLQGSIIELRAEYGSDGGAPCDGCEAAIRRLAKRVRAWRKARRLRP